MTDKNPALTIVMTVYNDENYIEETLRSLQAQTYPHFKIFISDDGSTDKSFEICQRFAQGDERIECVRHEQNMGSFNHFKYVVKMVNTPFLVLSSGHDVYDSHWVEKLLPRIRDNDEMVLVYPRTQVINFDRSFGRIYDDDYSTVGQNDPAKRYLYILKNMQWAAIFQGIWRTSVIQNIYVRPVISNDRLMVLNASFRGKFAQVPEVLFFMRRNREPDRGNKMYQREIRQITGHYPKMSTPSFILKIAMIRENIKMIFGEKVLSFSDKINLAAQSLYFWLKKFCLRQPYFKLKDFLKSLKPLAHE